MADSARMADRGFTRLHERARALGQDLRRVSFFAGTEQGQRFEVLKQDALTLLDGKVLPELLSALELPLFVAVLGGTNTGKSTFFNALAGVLLSETKVTAGATKHPLVYVHRRWEERLLSGQVFDRIRCVRCENPAQAIIATAEPQMLFAFHDRKELEDTAFVDSPDFDSVEPRNRETAHLVLTQSDVCVFLTTPQKYKDRVLVEDLEAVARQKKRCIAVFNFVDDDVIYRTMVEDLRQRVGPGIEFGGYLPQQDTRHPERKLEPRVKEILDGFLGGLSREAIKRDTLRQAIAALLAKVRQLIEGSRAEAGHKGGVLEALAREAERAAEGYRQGYQLDFPELGEALRRKLARLEVKALLPTVQGAAPRALGLVYHALGLGGGAVGSLIAQTLDAERPPADWDAHRERRDRQDLVQVKQLAQLLRSRLDSHLRGAAPTSALCLALLRDVFTKEALDRFDGEVEAAYAKRLEGERAVGDALLERTGPAAAASSGRFPAVLANAVKLACGIGLASATSGFGLWDLVFFPLGFVGGGYGIALALYGLLKRQRALQQEQRERWFREVMNEVLVEPLRARIETTASEDDLTRLGEHVDAIAALEV